MSSNLFYNNVRLHDSNRDFTNDNLRILASEQSNWKLQAVWRKRGGSYQSIYMFIQQGTNDFELFTVLRYCSDEEARKSPEERKACLAFRRIRLLQEGGLWTLNIPPDITEVFEYPAKIKMLESKLEELKKERKNEIEKIELERSSYHKTAIALSVMLALLVVAIVALSVRPVRRWCKKGKQNVQPKGRSLRNRLGTEISIDLH